MAKNYSKRIAGAIKDFLDADDWHYDWLEDKGFFKMSIESKTKFGHFDIFINVKSDGYSVNTIFPLNVSEDARHSVAEFITRANYGFFLGNFEMDFNDGDIRFKCSSSTGNDDSNLPSYDLIKESIYVCVFTCEKYGDGLAAVMFGMDTPENAINRIENN